MGEQLRKDLRIMDRKIPPVSASEAEDGLS